MYKQRDGVIWDTSRFEWIKYSQEGKRETRFIYCQDGDLGPNLARQC